METVFTVGPFIYSHEEVLAMGIGSRRAEAIYNSNGQGLEAAIVRDEEDRAARAGVVAVAFVSFANHPDLSG